MIDILKNKKVMLITIVSAVLAITLGFGVYFAFAFDGGDSGSGNDEGGGSGTVSGGKDWMYWFDKDENGDGKPDQGYSIKSIDFFWNKICEETSSTTHQPELFKGASDTDTPKQLFYRKCIHAMWDASADASISETMNELEDIINTGGGGAMGGSWAFSEELSNTMAGYSTKARIVAVGMRYSTDSNILLKNTNHNSPDNLITRPGNKNEWSTDFWDKEVPSVQWEVSAAPIMLNSSSYCKNYTWDKKKNFRNYVYGKYLDSGWVEFEDQITRDHSPRFYVIAVTDQDEVGVPVTLEKSITGADAAQGTWERYLADTAKNDDGSFYSLEGAEFTLYEEDGKTVAQGYLQKSKDTYEDDESDVIFTTDKKGKAKETFKVDPGDYYLKETKAPKGYLLDTDCDKTPDELDTHMDKGLLVSIEDGNDNLVEIEVEDRPAFTRVQLTKKIYGDTAGAGTFENLRYLATQNNNCYDLSGAVFNINKDDGSHLKGMLTSNGAFQDVAFTTNGAGVTQQYLVPLGNYWLVESVAPRAGYLKDTDGDGEPDETDTNTNWNGKRVTFPKQATTSVVINFDWYNVPMHEKQPINLFKRDGQTGAFVPYAQGAGSLSGGSYRFAYYKGLYTTIEQIPGYDKASNTFDWSQADTTAIWEVKSYYDEKTHGYGGRADFAKDTPIEGTWKYRTGGDNVCPLGTVVILENEPPEGYLIDSRAYNVSFTDDGTHLNSRIVHTQWGLNGEANNGDWNDFLNDYEINGDRDGMSNDWTLPEPEK